MIIGITFNSDVFRAFGIYNFLAGDAMKKHISQPSERARVSAASVDRATCFNLVELQAIGAMLLNSSLRKIKKPP